MTETSTAVPGGQIEQVPAATGSEARAELLTRSRRSAVPLRKSFVQAPRGAASRHGPLSALVRKGDLRALKAYLIVVAACSNGDQGWSTRHDSAVWARLMDIHETALAQGARTGAWRTLRRLEEQRLISCRRRRGSAEIPVTLLREDGSGTAYDRPRGATAEERFLKIPHAFWFRGYDERIDMPGLAVLLAVSREKPWSAFPSEKAPAWYGWSADTQMRGLHKLLELGLAERREHYAKAPLSPTGVTMTHQYRLVSWMQPSKNVNAPVRSASQPPAGSAPHDRG